MNHHVYNRVLARLREQVHRKRPGLWTPGFGRRWRVLLHHDNAPAHRALMNRAALNEAGVQLLRHPPYSPDLAPSDFWLFPRVKQVLRGRRFQNLAQLEDAVVMVLCSIPAAEFAEAFQDLRRRWEKCIAHAGEYFEGVRHLRPANAQVANPQTVELTTMDFPPDIDQEFVPL